jgi:hypothetical protein
LTTSGILPGHSLLTAANVTMQPEGVAPHSGRMAAVALRQITTADNSKEGLNNICRVSDVQHV